MTHNKKKAFSLVEFIIYFAIFAAVGVVLVNILLTTTDDRGVVAARSEVQQNIRYSILRMTQVIRSASAINDAHGSSLSVQTAQPQNSPTVFDLSNGVLRITEGSGLPQALTSDKVIVTALTFSKISNPQPAKDTVQINLTIAYKNNGNPQSQFSQSVETTASLKNFP